MIKVGERRERMTAVGWMEAYGPLLLSGAATVLSLILLGNSELRPSDSLSRLFDAAITFGSIIVGFVGALLAILVSVWDSDSIRKMFDSWVRDRLRSFFRGTIVGGFMLVTISGVLHLGSTLDRILPNGVRGITLFELVFSAWTGLSVYVLLAAYRIMHGMMYIIFNARRNENADLDPVEMDPGRKAKFRERIAQRDDKAP